MKSTINQPSCVPCSTPPEKTMFLLIDNYDSFTYNLVQAFYALGQDPVVVKNDDPRLLELAQDPSLNMVCLSPAIPRTPDTAWKSSASSIPKSRCSASASAIRPSALPPEPKSWSGPASCTARHPKSCMTARGFSQASRTPCAWGATIRWSSVPTWTRRTPNSRSRRTVPKAKSWPSAIRIARGWASSSIRNRS